jgi:adenosylcobyric acid synthase
VKWALEVVGLSNFLDKSPFNLSGGEKKRLALASVLAMRPEILVLDEPTNALDPKGASNLLDLLNQINRDLGVTLVFATHDVDRVPLLADRVYLLDQGRVLLSGPLAEVFSQKNVLRGMDLRLPRVAHLVELLMRDGVLPPGDLPLTIGAAWRLLSHTPPASDGKPGHSMQPTGEYSVQGGNMVRAISVLGTASDVGKSLVATALCRLLADQGFDVAPYKAQNMANQAGVTADGLEMPRAQILQAAACRKAPHVDMGPVLLKPLTHTGAQVIVLGRSLGIQEARDYFRDRAPYRDVALAALRRLAGQHEVIVLEGAGSPVELNLMGRDFVNLCPAREVDAALVLVADIDRGGVFAQVVGTLELLPPEDRARVLGIVVNRFRGDPELFADGIRILETRTGLPVLALVPHLEHGLDEEDRPFRIPVDQRAPAGMLKVGAVMYPRVSNTEDLAPLLAEPDLHLTWITDPALALEQDLLVLPGSKATVGDLVHLTVSGMAEALRVAARQGTWLLGLCGGYQMLGRELCDPGGSEGGPKLFPGLGLLPVATEFLAGKITRQSSARSQWPEPGHGLAGYEIHHGRTGLVEAQGEPLAEGGAAVGWRLERAAGGYLHGLLAADPWRSAYLNRVREDRGFPARPVRTADPLEARIDRWAAHVKANLRPGAWDLLLAAARRP